MQRRGGFHVNSPESVLTVDAERLYIACNYSHLVIYGARCVYIIKEGTLLHSFPANVNEASRRDNLRQSSTAVHCIVSLDTTRSASERILALEKQLTKVHASMALCIASALYAGLEADQLRRIQK